MNIVKEKLHYYFFNIAIILGIILIVFSPPMTVPDENTHFLNAYTIADGQIFLQKSDGKLGKYIPKSVIDFVDGNKSKFAGMDGKKYNFKEYYFNSYLTADREDKVFTSYWSQDINPISYIFSSIGIVLGKILLPKSFEISFNLLLFGRVFNLIFYVISMTYAIKIAPYYKNTMFLLALMPMSIYLGASISYDALIIPSAFLLFAYTLKLHESEKIVLKDIIIICCIMFMLFSVKQAYAPFALVLFSIPKKKFGDNKRYYKIIGTTLVVCIVAVIFSQINKSDLFSLQNDGNVNANVALQSEYLKKNFGIMIPLILKSFADYKTFYITGFVGTLGQLDTNLPMPLIVIFGLILIFVMLVDSFKAMKITVNFKLFGLVAVIIFVYFSFRAMYINWTPLVGPLYGDTVSGIQGRYFIPIAPFVCGIFANKFLLKYEVINKLMNSNTKLAYYVSIVFDIITSLTILLRYWG